MRAMRFRNRGGAGPTAARGSSSSSRPTPCASAAAAAARRTSVRARSGDQKRGVRGLEDFVIGGPKLRKWYGQEDGPPRDGGGAPEQRPEGDGADADAPRDVVLVTDAESEMGEQVVLQLILARANVRVLVNDVGAARAGYGPYVDPFSADVNGGGGLPRALKNVRTVIALGRLGKLLPAAKQAGVERVVMLSTAGMPQPGVLAALFGGGGGDAQLREPAREAQLAAGGLPYVILKAGPIQNVPGGSSALTFTAAGGGGGGGGGGAGQGVSREDLACAVARLVVEVALPEDAAATVVVGSAGPGGPPADWRAALQPLVAAA